MTFNLRGPILFTSLLKKGTSGFEKFIVAIVIILFLFAMSPIFFGDAFLESTGVVNNFPEWLIYFIILGVAIGVVYLIRR